MPLPTLPYKRPFFTVTLTAHEIDVSIQLGSFVGLRCQCTTSGLLHVLGCAVALVLPMK